ncbi:hypothetical protein B0H11DRAFT_1922253 [Mycena galericulata]|nr:hypothetical protein B0H11DRAFT_1922253 [Mycena galericulata]
MPRLTPSGIAANHSAWQQHPTARPTSTLTARPGCAKSLRGGPEQRIVNSRSENAKHPMRSIFKLPLIAHSRKPSRGVSTFPPRPVLSSCLAEASFLFLRVGHIRILKFIDFGGISYIRQTSVFRGFGYKIMALKDDGFINSHVDIRGQKNPTWNPRCPRPRAWIRKAESRLYLRRRDDANAKRASFITVWSAMSKHLPGSVVALSQTELSSEEHSNSTKTHFGRVKLEDPKQSLKKQSSNVGSTSASANKVFLPIPRAPQDTP